MRDETKGRDRQTQTVLDFGHGLSSVQRDYADNLYWHYDKRCENMDLLMTNLSVLTPTARALIPINASPNERHRLRVYEQWLQDNGMVWYQPDLLSYRDYLLQSYQGRNGKGLQPASVKTHLTTIRSTYRALLLDPITREYLFSIVEGTEFWEKKPFVDEIYLHLERAINPQRAPVKLITSQDQPDSKHTRLSTEQAMDLLQAPGTDSLMGLRDSCMIALMLCTGVREAELCGLDVEDVGQQLGGSYALHVRQGKGSKERLIPYGGLDWVLDIIDEWLIESRITEGALLRGFYKGGNTLRPYRLHVRAVNQILARYPVDIDGIPRKVNPHDLRRTYARLLYEAGVEVLAIRDNLGHSDTKTTLSYIGTMDVEARKPPEMFRFRLYGDE